MVGDGDGGVGGRGLVALRGLFTCFLTSLPVVLCLVLTHLEFQLHFLISNANVALPSRLLSSSSLPPFFLFRSYTF